jgi:hypothetical protein
MQAANSPAMEARGIRLQGELGISRQPIAQGRPVVSADTCMLVCVYLALVAHETAGASQHPVFPAPSDFSGARVQSQLGRNAQRECEVMSLLAITRRLPSPGGGGSARMSVARCETGWGDLSTRVLLDAERPSPHPTPPRASRASTLPLQGRVSFPHNSLAFENANELTRRVFSSSISVRVIGGSARWLQFSRSQSRQLTPIGVPSVFSRSIPAA